MSVFDCACRSELVDLQASVEVLTFVLDVQYDTFSCYACARLMSTFDSGFGAATSDDVRNKRAFVWLVAKKRELLKAHLTLSSVLHQQLMMSLSSANSLTTHCHLNYC